MADITTIGARVRRHRESRDLSPAQVAAAVGLSADDVVAIEGGRRPVEGGELADIAGFLDVSMRDLTSDRAAPDAAVVRVCGASTQGSA